MYTFGNFNHELDYILVNGYQCEIFSKRSIINGELKFKTETKETKPNQIISGVRKCSVKKTVKYFGINNFENCCFLNSTLQIVLNYSQFISSLKQYEIRSHGHSTIIEKILSYYNQIQPTCLDWNVNRLEDCIVYYGPKLPIINPCLDLISMLGFTKNQHEDAEEFLTKLLTQIHEDLLTCDFRPLSPNCLDNCDEDKWVEIGKGGKNLSPPREDGGEMSVDTVLSDLVSGKTIEKITKRNRIIQATATPFFILPLDIQHDDVTDVKTAICSLTRSEKLSDSYDRRMQIGHLPSLLIVQLKRFTFSKDVGIAKIQKKIDINSLLTIPNDCISSTITEETETSYQLYGVVFHIGEGVMKGHYTAAIRDGDDQWYYIDDSNVFLVQGKQSLDWLLNSSSAQIPDQLLSLDLNASAPRYACVAGRRSPYLIFYTKHA